MGSGDQTNEQKRAASSEGSSYRNRLGKEESEVFGRAMNALNGAGVEYLVAGAFAENVYTGVWRNTNDLDLFLQPADVRRALTALSGAGFRTEVLDGRWIAKAHWNDYLIDIIFSMSNGVLVVSGDWFERARPVEIAGASARLIPIEELIAAKVYVALRDRFDGADIMHLLRHSQGRVDWDRVLLRLGPFRELLLWYLVLFDFVYPGHSRYLPQELMRQLFEEARARWAANGASPRAFRGTLIDPYSFQVDIREWGYEDRRDRQPLVDAQGELIREPPSSQGDAIGEPPSQEDTAA